MISIPALPDLAPRALARLSLKALPPPARLARNGTVVTFGVFDGVHRGHLETLRRMKERAQQIQATPTAIVMRPRPAETLGLAPARPYLTSLEETVARIRDTGIDAVGILRFNRNLALASPHQFLAKLQARTQMRELWLGARARIGRGPEGSIESATAFGAQAGFAVVSCDELDVWDGRNQLQNGAEQLMDLNHALGRNYTLPSYAAPTRQALDADCGEFPLAFPKLLYLPPRGEYAVRVRPGRFGAEGVEEAALPGVGVVIVHASEQGRAVATLIGPHRLRWGDAFLVLEFVAGRAPDARQLLSWAAANADFNASPIAGPSGRG